MAPRPPRCRVLGDELSSARPQDPPPNPLLLGGPPATRSPRGGGEPGPWEGGAEPSWGRSVRAAGASVRAGVRAGWERRGGQQRAPGDPAVPGGVSQRLGRDVGGEEGVRESGSGPGHCPGAVSARVLVQPQCSASRKGSFWKPRLPAELTPPGSVGAPGAGVPPCSVLLHGARGRCRVPSRSVPVPRAAGRVRPCPQPTRGPGPGSAPVPASAGRERAA